MKVNGVAPAIIEETGMIPSDEAVGGIRHKISFGRDLPCRTYCVESQTRKG